MIIIHSLDDITFDIFPDLKKYQNNIEHNLEAIREYLIDYHTYSAFRPEVRIFNGIAEIKIDTETIEKFDSEFRKAIKLCEQQKFEQAKPILEKLIKANPTNSEFYRNYGQILETEGKWEEAQSYLIDSLKWDSRNKYALIMMGNIYARYKDDIDTATKYYNKVIAIDPNDYIALNNLGANLANLNKTDEAERYLQLAYEINDSYPNTSYGLALINQKKGNNEKAFDFAIKCINKVNVNDRLYLYAYKLAVESAEALSKEISPEKIYLRYSTLLEIKGERKVTVIEDNSIDYDAKLEIAENHNRDEHIIRYKGSTPAIHHLIMHELVHLDFMIEAREAGVNKLYINTNEHKKIFLKDIEPTLLKLESEGLTDKQIAKFSDMMFYGLNSQIYNAPIDLFIENYLYKEKPEVRPFQFLSLHKLLTEYIQSATSQSIKESSPKFVRDANTIYNLVHAYQFFDLYGIESIKAFKKPEFLGKAKNLYRTYYSKKDNRKEGEEYDFVQKWADELRLTKYFQLIDEKKYREDEKELPFEAMKTLENVISNMKEDPLNLKEGERTSNRVTFEEGSAGFMAVMMYCIDALQYFENLSLTEIQKITYEIAMLGTYGLDPYNSEKKYTLSTVPERKYTALQMLAWEYVGFQTIDQSLDIGLDFEKEYEMAKKTYKK
jgi:tetratricopeptide (TPR) repeat protein